MMRKLDPDRRILSWALTLAAPVLLLPASVLAALAPTPDSTEGPFYPERIPEDDNGDLVHVDGVDRDAIGDILHLSGRILDTTGQAVPGARVEIWQCDANGVYLHAGDRHFAMRDRAFQGFGHVTTGTDGRFAFRTIVPVPYTARTPHIHVKVLHGGRERLTSQLYLKGHRKNAIDFLFHSLSADERRQVEMVLKPHEANTGKEFETEIDLVVA
ncbi:MAG: protocatechuate 3,4-dioxygenase [Rhodospirillaceae bacterium]|jgi:protocatechuate 3,4-dioxygenase, beta subunit|nr:protocatechuate 3,4-dioxygenase [Rhodospirillaceae bacterium]MBT5192767.1 protocatechuate 3,4-dioxygenase [Rhodospirillaceae bacterium]MBT5898435.1 protocatechuate 3,4-dioxygenase [Rhodospirillaceae bacterium]MBT6430778.1 protocatechuate 3,4-dioxygenase [Rhodospirillaceae bacterium]MBT7755832.1 protocatechuate 3,4-dioxygenase [Rhodospirillaceae bacterium]